MEEWRKYCILDGHKILYKGIDIGLTAEFINDVYINTGMEIDDSTIEGMYNQNISVIRDKKIDQILGN